MSGDPGYPSEQLENAVDRAIVNWDDVIEDLEATAAEYRSEGLETVEAHPGDVVTVADLEHAKMLGLSILLPDNEFEDVRAAMDERDLSFDRYDVFEGVRDGLRFMLVALQDTEEDYCLVFPAYYDTAIAGEMVEMVRDRGWMGLYFRRFGSDDLLSVVLEEPEKLLPDEE